MTTREQYVAELTEGVAGGPGWAAYRAEQATRLLALADSAWLHAARWGRWEAVGGAVAVLAGQSAKVASVVAVARGVRASKLG